MHDAARSNFANTQPAGQPREMTALEALKSKLADLNGSMAVAHDSLQAIADAAFGARGLNAVAPAPAPVRSGTLGDVADKVDALKRQLSDVHDQIEGFKSL